MTLTATVHVVDPIYIRDSICTNIGSILQQEESIERSLEIGQNILIWNYRIYGDAMRRYILGQGKDWSATPRKSSTINEAKEWLAAKKKKSVHSLRHWFDTIEKIHNLLGDMPRENILGLRGITVRDIRNSTVEEVRKMRKRLEYEANSSE